MEQYLCVRFLTLLCCASAAFALTCLKCDGISQPRHCRQVVECNANEQCLTEKTVNSFGEVVFNLGCLHSTECNRQSHDAHATCSQCCSKDICNSVGCGQPDYPASRGPICYSCPLYSDLHRCHDIDFCSIGEVCSLSGRYEFSEMVFESRCSAKETCSDILTGSSVSVGKKRSHQQHACDACCTTDLCNKNCSVASLPSTGSPPVTGGNYADCKELYDAGFTTDGLYTTYWKGNAVQVFCDMTTDGGGWTVFQYRYNGSVDFYKTFPEYEAGFGKYPGEFWQGLKWLNWITNRKNYTLRVDLTAPNGTKGYAKYTTFIVGPPGRYELNEAGYSGNAGDSFHRQFGAAFSTYDNDRDGWSGSTNCAEEYHGAWWYDTCFDSNLNARYNPGNTSNQNMIWAHWPDEDTFYLGLKGSQMSIRPM